MGVCESSVILYKVSDKPKELKKGEPEKVLGEPRERKTVNFYINQSYIRVQENKESQLWQLNDCAIDSSGRFYGSVIYEELGSDEIALNFVTA